MTDIVERLRYQHTKVDVAGYWLDANTARPIMHEAADEIERLRKLAKEQGQEIAITREQDERLRSALLGHAREMARVALTDSSSTMEK
jgi:MFS superfamily sulfate permease-like transporter